jgi:hypothetical protein
MKKECITTDNINTRAREALLIMTETQIANNAERWKLHKELSNIIGFKAPIDGVLSVATSKVEIDIIKLDKELQDRDAEYDSDNCTYKGKPDYSCRDYIKERFGNRAIELIEILL